MCDFKLNLQNAKLLADGLWAVERFFEPKDFEYIQQSVLSVDSGLFVASPASPLRQELTWSIDGILEELTNSLPDVSSKTSTLVGKQLQCNQIRVWRDLPGYRIPFHEDDDVVYAHFQVYIASGQSDVGTTWYTSTGKYTCPFVPNTGYITVCDKRLPHGMLTAVKDTNRYSLYATFK